MCDEIKPEVGGVLYRITACYSYSNPSLHLNRYRVVKVTNSGCWVVDFWDEYRLLNKTVPEKELFAKLREQKRLRWTSSSGRKRFCYPSIELAAESFLARKRRQRVIIQRQLSEVEDILSFSDQIGKLTPECFSGNGLFIHASEIEKTLRGPEIPPLPNLNDPIVTFTSGIKDQK